jgi:hypothetical protein
VLTNHGNILVRLNPEKADAQVKQFPLMLKDEKGQEVWCLLPDPKVDISVVQLNPQFLREQGFRRRSLRATSMPLTKQR